MKTVKNNWDLKTATTCKEKPMEMDAKSDTVSNNNCSSSDSNKDSNPCPICLRSIHEDAYLDRCFRKPHLSLSSLLQLNCRFWFSVF